MNGKLCLGVMIILLLLIVYNLTNKEHFFNTTRVDVHPDVNFSEYLKGLNSNKGIKNIDDIPMNVINPPMPNKLESGEVVNDDPTNEQMYNSSAINQNIGMNYPFNKNNNKSLNNESENSNKKQSITFNSNSPLNSYVKKSDLERAAAAAAKVYCPVGPEYNPNDYILKSQMKINNLNTKCPKVPDLKDYVLKSTIPPQQQCPPCICPKVRVSAGLCKQSDCSVEKCKRVVKCPEVKPCTIDDVKVCPAIKIPNIKDLKCPVVQQVNDLSIKTDPDSKYKLEQIKKIIDDASSKQEGFLDFKLFTRPTEEEQDSEDAEELLDYSDNTCAPIKYKRKLNSNGLLGSMFD